MYDVLEHRAFMHKDKVSANLTHSWKLYSYTISNQNLEGFFCYYTRVLCAVAKKFSSLKVLSTVLSTRTRSTPLDNPLPSMLGLGTGHSPRRITEYWPPGINNFLHMPHATRSTPSLYVQY